MKSSPITLPTQLPPPVAMALFEALQTLCDALWQEYETVLLELIMQELSQPADPADEEVFDLEDDDIPF